MSLTHEFCILPKGEEYASAIKVKPKVIIDDNLVFYMEDTLFWIKTRNPSKNTIGDGLNYHGLSAIENTELEKLNDIILHWIRLFSLGPDNITMRVRYVMSFDRQKGNYEMVTYKKSEIIEQLSALAGIIKTAIENADSILHMGI